MAQRQKDKKPKVAEADESKPLGDDSDASEDALANAEDEDEGAAKAKDDASEGDDGAAEPKAAGAENDEEEGDEELVVAGQLGTERYVMAGFFAAAMLGAYVFGRAVQSIWAAASNKDWFSQTFPRLAAVPDDEKSTIGLIVGGIVALILALRTYRRPDIRTWTDEVASELAKVKWPTRKEVSNSTVIVIAASTVATIYLALLDRFWAFVTNIVYGDGS